MSRSVCQRASLPQEEFDIDGEKKRGNLMQAQRVPRARRDRNPACEGWHGAVVTGIVGTVTTCRDTKTKQTEERNMDQKREVRVKSDYKRQIFRSRAQQFGTFLKGNTRIMVFNPI